MSFFHPLGELFQREAVRAVFLVEDKSLWLPELEYLKQITGQDADTLESKANLSKEETGDSTQNLPAVSGSEIEEYLTSLYSKSGEPEIQIDPEILSQFTLSQGDRKEFSLVYDPESLENLRKNPQTGIQSKKIIGLIYPYGYHSPVSGIPQPLSLSPVNIQIKDLAPWAERVLKKIEGNWIIDPAQSRDLKTTISVSVTITKSGDITGVEVIKSSGEKMLDSAAVDAVKKSIPLPGLPILYPSGFIVITIEFEYDV